jgi:DNA-binding GntR family transcriptional regulator
MQDFIVDLRSAGWTIGASDCLCCCRKYNSSRDEVSMVKASATTMPSVPPVAKPGPTRLARRIVALAASGGWSRGRHITEAELVEALGVSRTPVRSALRLLAEVGVVEARQNQGFFLRLDGLHLAVFELDHAPTAVEELYGRMLRDRISGDLPRQVGRAELASRYGAGRATLDQALARLADDGLVFRGEGRIWRFVESLTDGGSVRASYEFRLAVEPAALSLRSFRSSPAVLMRLRERHLALIERLHDPAAPSARPSASLRTLIVGLDADFHEGLAALSGNPFVAAAVKQQVAMRRLLEFGIQEQAPRITVWCREHLAVTDALLRGDCAGAAARLAEHLEQAMRRAVTDPAALAARPAWADSP